MAGFATSNLVRPVDHVCKTVLGPYAGPLAGVDVAAFVAGHLIQACTAAVAESNEPRVARIQAIVDEQAAHAIGDISRTPLADIKIPAGPNVMCQETLGRFMPAGDGNPYDPLTVTGLPPALGQRLVAACLRAAQSVVDAKLLRLASGAIEQAHPVEDTVLQWDKVFWYAQPPGGTAFITDRTLEANKTRAVYLALVEHGIPGIAGKAGLARLRKAAATRFADQIDAAYGDAQFSDPPAAKKLCAGRYSTPGQVAMDTVTGTHTRSADETRDVLTKLRALPDMSAMDAQNWLTNSCRQHSDTLLGRRLDEAARSSGVDRVFSPGEKLSVRDQDGKLRQADPAALAQSAAVDGLQVRFVPGGTFSSAKMLVTPFGKDGPVLSGSLKPAKRADGVPMLDVENFRTLPGIDGPMATLQCIGMPVAQTSFDGRLQLIGGVAGMLWAYATDGARQDMREGRETMANAEDCAKAKTTFAGE